MISICLLSFMLLTVMQTSFAQFRSIPSEVTEALKAKYPSATNVTWSDKITAFVAKFTQDNAKYEAKFGNKGEWQGSVKDLTQDNIPQAVKDGFSKSMYADWKVKNQHEIFLPVDSIQYHIQVTKGDLQKRNLLFSRTGKLLKDNATL